MKNEDENVESNLIDVQPLISGNEIFSVSESICDTDNNESRSIFIQGITLWALV